MHDDFILAGSHPVIHNHIFSGHMLMPGVAYVDLLYQFFRERGYDYKHLRLRNMTIYHPLVVEASSPVHVQIECGADEDGIWRLTLEGGFKEQERKRYVTAEIDKVPAPAFTDTIDFDHIRHSATSSFPMERLYKSFKEIGLIHSGMMRVAGTVYLTESAICAEYRLNPEALEGASEVIFHPALIDAATVCAEGCLAILDPTTSERLYLPLLCSSFRAADMMQTQGTIRIPLEFARRTGELTRYTIQFFDQHGKQVAELADFTGKLVRNLSFLDQQDQFSASVAASKMLALSGPSDLVERSDQASVVPFIEQMLCGLIADRLGCDTRDVDVNTGYYEMGISSALLLELVHALESQARIKLVPTLLFEYSTVADLTQYLVSKYAERFDALRASASPQPAYPEPSHCLRDPSTERKQIPPVTRSIDDDVAIIGMAGRFPGADSVSEFWQNLKAGKNSVTEIPETRWAWRRFDSIRSPSGKSISRWGGFLRQIDCFDAPFFKISPREAEITDPQERLFLETCWEAIEDAGHTPSSLAQHGGPDSPSKVGVYAGVMHRDYLLLAAERRSREFGLLLSMASIANRVSYVCDFNGPSMTIDTVCSSSLTALHLAVEAIKRGECEVALAGGVNLSIHPNKYLSYGLMEMHSSDGTCNAFGTDGDGYVSGEAVGAVLLKPLNSAIRDGDRIYAVVKSSDINHVGKVSGITVPSPTAQANLVTNCCEKAGINPRTISYIEAHGTGTSLGDPIELAGLTKAFRRYTDDVHFCAVGSVKSNIGHGESAAGISALIKVALQIYHRTLTPSLHARELNPHISWDDSPFVVQRETKPWVSSSPGGWGGALPPLTAGLSSFGATGSNAHVILQQYQAPDASLQRQPHNSTSDTWKIVVVSARTEERLHDYVTNIVAFINERVLSSVSGLENITLSDLAYTLQVGRVPMRVRIAFVVKNFSELSRKMSAFSGGDSSSEICFLGKIKGSSPMTSSVSGQSAKATSGILDKAALEQIAQSWVKGFEINWEGLYPDGRPRKVSLPTYPFARERHWIDLKDNEVNPAQERPSQNELNPEPDSSRSDSATQTYTRVFDGEEFFFRDHVVRGKRTLPGVAYLEMARAVLCRAIAKCDSDVGRFMPIRLKNVLWARPVIVDGNPVAVDVKLQRDGESDFYIETFRRNTSPGAKDSEEGALTSRGYAERLDATSPAPLALSTIRTDLAHNSLLSASECYAMLAEIGLDYGPAHRAIDSISIGTDTAGSTQALARLVLPGSVEQVHHYVLHPSIMDAALQACVTLLGAKKPSQSGEAKPSSPLPFAVEQVDVLRPTPATGWAWIRYGEDARKRASRKIDIDICDDDGRVCVSLRAFSTRETSAARASSESAPDLTKPKDRQEVLTVLPVWDLIKVEKHVVEPPHEHRFLVVGSVAAARDDVLQSYPESYIASFDARSTMTDIVKELRSIRGFTHILWVVADDAAQTPLDLLSPDAASRDVIHGLTLVKALIELGFEAKALQWTVITNQAQSVLQGEAAHASAAAVHGLIGSMAKEYPQWRVRLLDLEAGQPLNVSGLLRLPFNPQGDALAIRRGETYALRLIPLELPTPRTSRFRRGGVYLIIGGAGGIGEALSEYLTRSYDAQTIWIGRRELDAQIAAKQDNIGSIGRKPLYINLNAGDCEAMANALLAIKKEYGVVHGVVHSAIVLSDNSLAKMSEESFKNALAAKIDVSLALARVFRNEPLDFLLMFSSIQSYTKSPGQSNYAAGSIFEDVFGTQMLHQLNLPVKTINWGYWGDIGVVASEAYRKRMLQAGMGSISAAEAMERIEQLLLAPLSQMSFFKLLQPIAAERFALNIDRSQSMTMTQTEAPVVQESLELPISFKSLGTEVVGRFRNRSSQLDGLSVRLLWSQLQTLDLTSELSLSTGSESHGRVKPIYNRWLDESLRMLAEWRYIHLTGNRCDILKDPSQDAGIWDEWASFGENADDVTVKGRWSLLNLCLRSLPAILDGNRTSVEVMFPGSSTAVVELIYRNNPVADFFNSAVAYTVRQYVNNRLSTQPDCRLRILELGAGTGATSSAVLEQLEGFQQHILEYCFTDISKGFLINAEKLYASRYPFVQQRLLDIEMPIEHQNFNLGTYDIVIAANVLHATKDIRSTLRNVKSLLQKNGLLLLNEIATREIFTHLTFGLLEGWWLAHDPEVRLQGSPGIAPDNWRMLLEKEGFNDIAFPVEDSHGGGQQVIVATSDGMIRHTRRVAETFVAPASRVGLRATRQEAAAHSEFTRKMEEAIPTERVFARSTLDSPKEVLADHVRDVIVAKLSDSLKVAPDAIDVDESFADYGLDSITAIHFTQQINSALKIDLVTTSVFDYSSVAKLSAHILEENEPAHLSALNPLLSGPKHKRLQDVHSSYDRVASFSSDPPTSSHAAVNAPLVSGLSVGEDDLAIMNDDEVEVMLLNYLKLSEI